MTISRRDFVRTAVASSVLAGWSRAAEPLKSEFPGLIVRAHQPSNLEFPLSALKDAIVPNEQFFVRSHFAVPTIEANDWRLKVEGEVERPFEMTYKELTRGSSSSLTATIECAGNGRVHLIPAVAGVQWGQGAVGNAEWTGIPLASLLEKAGLKKNAVEVILEGTDEGTDPKAPGPIHFARSLPLAKAKSDQVLLAYKMNGETLPVSHGYPLRAVVGGWYGAASVKWLKRIIVTDKPFPGFFQTLDYSYFVRCDDLPIVVPVTAMEPKAILARPALGEAISAGKPYRLFGTAWAGENAIKKVEVSIDGGKTWAKAKLLGEAKPIQWVLWEYVWEKPARGDASIVAKATDEKGRTQPLKRDPDRRSYMINHLVPTGVTVK